MPKTTEAQTQESAGTETAGPHSMTRKPDDEIPLELKTYTVEQLAVILQRSVKSIKVDVTRNPRSLPPIFRVPGSRKILIRHVDLRAWMDDLSFQAERRRDAEAAADRFAIVRQPRRRTR